VASIDENSARRHGLWLLAFGTPLIEAWPRRVNARG
jgi:hypothetical protein